VIADVIGRIPGVTHSETFVEVAGRELDVSFNLASAPEIQN